MLVNNAGIAPAAGRFDLLPIENHHRLFDVHVHGVFYGMCAMVALLERSRAASIINISSIDGLVGIGGLTSYTASKFAVTGMTRSAAIDLGPLGIRVNSIHPGVIDSPMVRNIQGKGRERLDNTVRRQPLRARASRARSRTWRFSWPRTNPRTAPERSSPRTAVISRARTAIRIRNEPNRRRHNSCHRPTTPRSVRLPCLLSSTSSISPAGWQ